MDIDLNPTSGRSSQQRTGVFISYSHKDKEWLEKLKTVLKPSVQLGTITTWDDTKIRAGADWREEIDEALNSAKVAVLLVTPEFLASDFIGEAELPHLLQAAKQEGLTILWIAVRPSLYDRTPIGKYQAANNPKNPLNKLSDWELDEELLKICEQIERAATTALVPKVSAKGTPKPSNSSVLLGTADSEIHSRPAQYGFPDDLIDFEAPQHLFKEMLADSPEKRLMFIQAPYGHGKTSLLRMLGFHCEQEGIPFCSIDFSGQPYDNPHFTLALVICDQLGLSPRHLARALQSFSTYKPQEEIKDPYDILGGVSETHEGLRQRHIKELLKKAFLADLGQLVAQKGRAVCLLDSFEHIRAEEEDWLLDTLLKPVARGLKGVMIVTAGRRWPNINEWELDKYTHRIDGLPKLNEEHVKLYAEKLNIKISDEDARAAVRLSAGGVPHHIAIMVSNLRET